jgi:hypothetical protein
MALLLCYMSFMLNIIYADCHKYALNIECHYAECHYDERRGA